MLLDNWGPGALNRLGLGYDQLREINPGLVYASITGFGDSDDLPLSAQSAIPDRRALRVRFRIGGRRFERTVGAIVGLSDPDRLVVV